MKFLDRDPWAFFIGLGQAVAIVWAVPIIIVGFALAVQAVVGP